jgi:3-deoxy-D-manno-octulosonic-acid transferase
MARLLLLLLHNLLLPFVLLFMAPAAMRKMRARGGKLSDLWQRFGFFQAKAKAQLAELSARGPVFWVHAASVGEVGVAIRLIRELQKQQPTLGAVLTTTTPTGFAEAEKATAKLGGSVIPLYSALDGWFIVRRFLKVIQPQQLVLVESEVWPNLVSACYSRGIPVSLVNARLSPRSEGRYRKVLPFARSIFSMFSRIYVQEPEDIARWTGLGVPRDQVEQPGSIKFDVKGQSEPVEQVAHFQSLVQSLGWQKDEAILLAASTHAGEEAELARVFLALKDSFPGLRFIVVPRHAERAAVVQEDMRKVGLRSVLRSSVDVAKPKESGCDCLLVDSTGELRAWQYLATAVIVGKSFLAKGGQNPAEAVMAGKPVLFGPHMENFASLVRHLRSRGGALQVGDFYKLEEKLRHLLRHPDFARETAEAGREALQPHDGATKRTAESLLKAVSQSKTL